jgi:hypothetical protein
MRGRKLIFLAPLALVGIAIFIAIGGGVVMQLWNWLTPALFGWHVITFWQALGLLVLCRILFGGFGMHGRRSRRWRGRRWHRPTWEERERFKEAVRDRYGPSAPMA